MDSVLRLLDWRGQKIDHAFLHSRAPKGYGAEHAVEEQVRDLIDDVRRRGVSALVEQAARFDGGAPDDIVVPHHLRRQALSTLDSTVRRAIEESIDRVRRASAAQIPPETLTEIADGATILQRWRPVDRAGVYVPGGKAVYPSSVVMNVVAAQVAGVGSIALCSPPQAAFGGSIHPTILATAELLGVDELYAIGGAGAIAALAWGVPEIGLDPVSVITGPGNQYVATAKRLVKGVVGIDSEAGPTEIVVIADETADPEFVAADLVSQAEHDEQAQSILITIDESLAREVIERVGLRAHQTAHSARVNVSLSGEQSAVIIVSTLEDAIRVTDYLAPEHLEVMTTQPREVAARVSHAGAVFLGPYTPVSAGDYLAGSNHVLPTSRQARFQAGLSASTFLRPQQVVEYSREALREIAPLIVSFAQAEHLPAHGQAVEARFEREGE